MRKILIKAEAVLVVLILFFSVILIVADNIFPAFGIHFDVSANGHSMDPTLLKGSMCIWSDRIPFSDLEVGDIIIYRDWADTIGNTKLSVTVTTKVYKEGEEPPAEDTEKQTYRDEGIEYASDQYTLHRIVEIRQDDEYLDRALFTRGDNNNPHSVDPHPTFESGYVGAVIWHMNYIGWPFRIMYTNRGLIWLIGAACILGIILLIWLLFTPSESSDKAADK